MTCIIIIYEADAKYNILRLSVWKFSHQYINYNFNTELRAAFSV